MTKVLKIIILLIFASALILPKFFISAQEEMSQTCDIKNIENECDNNSSSQCRDLLQKCDNYYQEQAAAISQDINKTQKDKQTLQTKISGLRKQIQNLEYQIYQSNLMIGDLGVQIKDTEFSIDKTSLQIEDIKDRLSSVIVKINEQDYRSLVEIMLSEGLSDFFDNLVAYGSLSSETKTLLGEIKSLKNSLETQKQSLDTDKDKLENQVKLQTAQKQQNNSLKSQQEYYLKLTEAQYQQQLKEKADIEKVAAQIRSRLFSLVGVSEAPTFGEALDTAKSVASLIGIRPAFLLAIISQESSIGKNVGQCVLTDLTTGAGKTISTGKILSRVMKPARDITPFLSITSALGKDPYNTAVSCPLSVGYGGAMGPAQFIPSTWSLYIDKLANLLGKAGNPWNIRDSFTASALYLYDLGASTQTTATEKKAASRYYGGSSAYANSVIKRASCIQTFIDSGSMSSTCENLIL